MQIKLHHILIVGAGVCLLAFTIMLARKDDSQTLKAAASPEKVVAGRKDFFDVPSVEEEAFRKLTAQEHLEIAHKFLYDPEYYEPDEKLRESRFSPDRWFGNVTDAKKHLLAISKDSPEYVKATKLLNEVSLREKKLEAVANKQFAEKRAGAAQARVTERINFANDYENALLDKGMDVHIILSGKNKTTMTMKYVLMSRPLVHQLTNDSQWMSKIRSLGFMKIIFTDGYDNSWPLDL